LDEIISTSSKVGPEDVLELQQNVSMLKAKLEASSTMPLLYLILTIN
jgi:hypothetical protein